MIYEILTKHKSSILEKWTQVILDSYSSRTSEFLKLEKDQFSNPVGYIIKENAEKIYDELLASRDYITLKVSLADIIRIRAIQDFSPTQAISFVFQLKDVILEELKKDLSEKENLDECLELFSKIDEIVLIAFDLYSEFREKVYRIRVKEIKTNSQKILD
jgi:hypothetical protein